MVPARTQVSLDPPPWEEFTIMLPSFRATRDKPPGSTQVSRPVMAKGRKSRCRGPQAAWSVKVGGHRQIDQRLG